MPTYKALSKTAIERRRYWVDEIVKISGRFGDDSGRVEAELAAEMEKDGSGALIDHLQLCGAIPEQYGHDSSEEKLYSKYTDALLAAALSHVGLTSRVLKERADAADVEAFGADYALVGDAKVFRLSRTAKNQKDFKVEAMHGWKRGKPHAVIVCPIYQLPSRSSQIYHQAIARNVCLFTYSHLSVLVRFADAVSSKAAQQLLLTALKCAESMNPAKDAVAYWSNLNRAMMKFHGSVDRLWQAEKLVTPDSIAAAKEEALTFFARQRAAIMRMSHEEAIQELIRDRNIDGREGVVRAVTGNAIFSFT